MAAPRPPRSAGGGRYSAPVDIEEFYDADERRRASAEAELGRDWHDRGGARYELNWVADTGELYVVRQPPVSGEWEGPFGGLHVPANAPKVAKDMTVHVIGHVPTHDQLQQVLDGWEQAMAGEDGIGWLVDRLRSHGIEPPPELVDPPGTAGR